MVMGLNRKSLLVRIDAQLDAERSAILKGDLGSLGPMISSREEMVGALEGTIDPGDSKAIRQIEGLQKKARRNATLIRAAIEGITSANKIVSEIEAAHAKLSTYSEQGQMHHVLRPKSTVTKRA